jgi:hypothetical protein
MDARRFDSLSRSLTEAGTRHGVLAFLATLPILGGLLVPSIRTRLDAKGRRKRRKKGHKHGKGNGGHRKGKRKCKAHAKAKTCAGKCVGSGTTARRRSIAGRVIATRSASRASPVKGR